MPLYARHCTNPKCRDRGKLVERFARASEHKKACGPCETCGKPTDIHPGAMMGVTFQREWKRGWGGVERESKGLVFQEAGIPEILADCPSMDFKVRDGEAIPVFKNDAHHRRCLKELRRARDKYQGEKRARKQRVRSAVDKTSVIRDLKQKAGIKP